MNMRYKYRFPDPRKETKEVRFAQSIVHEAAKASFYPRLQDCV